MQTFSQMVDSMISETRRPDLVSDISRYLNQTIRECHADPVKNAVVLYGENYKELRLTATSETGFSWYPEKPQLMQHVSTVRYSSLSDLSGNPIWPRLAIPGPHLRDIDYFYYRTGGADVFGGNRGYGGIGATIDIGYYEYPRTLVYAPVGKRPADFNAEGGWLYDPDWSRTEELQAQARELSTNWMLLRWADVLAEGLRAKTYKRISDDTRARTCYSLYMQLRMGLYTAETLDPGFVR